MCRVRNTHTTAPWTTAYICLTLDESCTDANGKYVDKPLTVRMVQWQPYCLKESFDPKTPVCAACKKTNRTRSFCRERHKHRQLPWCTVYVLLSALETADPTTIVAGASKPVDESGKKGGSKDEAATPEEGSSKEATSPLTAGAQDEASAAESKTSDNNDGDNVAKQEDGRKTSGGDDGDDINDIPESRTFLAKVSCKSTTIHWLELSELEGAEGGNSMPSMHNADTNMYGVPVPPDPNNPYYHHHAYQQQQAAAMKNHQQYFFQPQRYPNPYAASHAAWQAHYNQQPPPHMPMHPGHGQPATPTQAPTPGAAPPADGSPAQPPVSAGEAAAQQQKRNRQMAEDGGAPSPIHPPPPGGHPHGPPGGPHGQPQQWMLYQQMYQAQLPPMAHPPPYASSGRPMAPQEGGNTGAMMANSETYNGPQSPPKDSEEGDAKRQRLV